MSTSIVDANGAMITELLARTAIQESMKGDLTVTAKYQKGELAWRMSSAQKAAILNTAVFTIEPSPDGFGVTFIGVDLILDETVPTDEIELEDESVIPPATVGLIINLAVPSAC